MSSKRFEKSIDQYHPSDSDEDYNEAEKHLLDKYRNRRQEQSDSENEVFGVGSEAESSDDNKSDIASSDVEEEDDGLPDAKAWGKDKRKFYGADYIDPDYGGFQGKDAQSAQIEEEEARNIQTQLLEQLDDDDFSLGMFHKEKSAKKERRSQADEIIKTDISQLTDKQKLSILEKDTPELFGLIEDFNIKMTIARDYLAPMLKRHKLGIVSGGGPIEFIQTQYQLILNYATNIYMYLLLTNKRELLKHHPVIKRLYQYRQLLSQMEPIFEEIVKPQIELILLETDVKKNPSKKSKKTLKLLSNLKISSKNKRTAKPTEESVQNKKIKLAKYDDLETFSKEDQTHNITDEAEDDDTVDLENNDTPEVYEGEDNRRAITYEMAKNKGVTPHRKKELRNPRVKNKLKYRKAIIRRKGAVREPRKELSRYGGEMSGIKTTVSKSIKLKS